MPAKNEDLHGSAPDKCGTALLLIDIMTKSRVTSVVRAPFTRYEKSAGAGEVEERPRGRGLRRAIGELVSCPFCLGTWIACVGVAGLVTRPRLTRALASIFGVGSIADFIQQA
jgi:Protein of unknown function (DUF1360)